VRAGRAHTKPPQWHASGRCERECTLHNRRGTVGRGEGVSNGVINNRRMPSLRRTLEYNSHRRALECWAVTPSASACSTSPKEKMSSHSLPNYGIQESSDGGGVPRQPVRRHKCVCARVPASVVPFLVNTREQDSHSHGRCSLSSTVADDAGAVLTDTLRSCGDDQRCCVSSEASVSWASWAQRRALKQCKACKQPLRGLDLQQGRSS
jgi:hypothetical protein